MSKAVSQAEALMDKGAQAVQDHDDPFRMRQAAEVWKVGHEGARKALGLDNQEAANRPVAVNIAIQGGLRPVGPVVDVTPAQSG